MELLIRTLLDGDQAQTLAEADRLFTMGFAPEEIVAAGVQAAMSQLDAKCTAQQFNLLEIMLVGRAAMAVIRHFYPLDHVLPPTKATVVVATPQGDIHDLGKNILSTVLLGKGYRVVDCGRDCALDNLLDAAEREGADVIGVSGLLTTVIPTVCQLKDMAIQRGLGHIRIMAGGAALKQSTAERLNVDFVADTAFDGARYLDALLEETR